MLLDRDRRRRHLTTGLLLLAAVSTASCGGGGGGSDGGGLVAEPAPIATPSPNTFTTPTLAPEPTTQPTPDPGPSDPLEILRLGPDFSSFGDTPVDLPILVSRDGGVVAHTQQDHRSYYFPDPFFPQFLREGVEYCTRASVWRGRGPAMPLDPDPGCPFPERDDQPSGDSWPAGLSADGSVALVDRVLKTDDGANANFGLAGADGDWQEVVLDVLHPDAARTPQLRANDLSGDGTLVVGMAWLDYPFPGFRPSDARAFLYRRGDTAPTWLPAPGDRIETADFVSDDGCVIVGCCEDDGDDPARSLPVVWRDRGAPSTLRPPAEAGTHCRVHDLSADGRVAVGVCGVVAVRWVDGEPSVIVVPGGPPADGVLASVALATSEDGSVVLGRSNAPELHAGWLWTADGGVESVAALLEDLGIETGEQTSVGRQLLRATALARGGKVLVGRGERGSGATYEPFLFRVTLP